MNDFEREKAAEPVRPSHFVAMRAAFPAERTEVGDLLGEKGPLAQSLPGYQPRPAQVALAEAVYQGLTERQHVIAEAGTGTGKSLGALIPAIKYAKEQGGAFRNKRILVSTAMLILQDQYTGKDLPFLTEHLGIRFSWCVRKGRSNYACPKRLERAQLGKLEVHPVDRSMFETVCEWAEESELGDVAELPFELSKQPRLKSVCTANSDNCSGSKCAWFNDCFYYQSKDRAEQCEIIVVNHALLVMNEHFHGQILPDYDAVIIDEAHKLEDIVRSNLESSLNPRSFQKLLKSAKTLQLFNEERAEAWQEKSDAFLAIIDGELERILRKPGKFRFDPATCSDDFKTALDGLREIVVQIFVSAREVATKDETSSDASQVKALMQAAESMGHGLRAFITPSPVNVIWAERTKRKDRPDRLSLHTAPISVAGWMKANLLTRPCVFLSATLATGRGEEAFAHFKERLGIEKAIELQVDSPFDYARHSRYVLGFYPGGLDKPPRDQREWAELVYPRLRLVIDNTDGGALVLCTSWGVCDELYWMLAGDNERGWNLLKQGDMSKADLIASFKGNENSVLVATGSFFEGVDIPGRALRVVAIDKIPFPIATDPVQSAIGDSYGKASFRKHWIPHAITHMKQGVGRLIRSEADRGLVLLLDPRFRSKAYSRQILDALPGYTAPADKTEIERFTSDEYWQKQSS